MSESEDLKAAMLEIGRLRARVQELEAAMREIYEVYAGSDGFIAETAAEGYQQRLIEQMTAIARDHLPTPPEDSSDDAEHDNR